MSLKNALETAKEILAQHIEEQLDETYTEPEEIKKKKGTKARGEDKDVEVTADGEGAKLAMAHLKFAEPLDAAQLGKEVVDDLKEKRKKKRKTWNEEDMEDGR